jgi:hypothetical protein
MEQWRNEIVHFPCIFLPPLPLGCFPLSSYSCKIYSSLLKTYISQTLGHCLELLFSCVMCVDELACSSPVNPSFVARVDLNYVLMSIGGKYIISPSFMNDTHIW